LIPDLLYALLDIQTQRIAIRYRVVEYVPIEIGVTAVQPDRVFADEPACGGVVESGAFIFPDAFRW
jgi:hypothetical protein